MKRYSNNNRNKNESNWPDSNMHANQQRQYNKQVGRFYKSNLDEKINQTVQQQQKQPHKITDSILKTPVKNEKQKQMHMDTPVKESLDYSGSSSAYDSDEIDENNNNMKNTSSQSLNSTIECGNTSCSNQMGSSCEQTELHNQQLPHPNGGNMMTMMMTPSSEHGIPYGYYSVPVSDYDYNNNMMQTNHVSTPYYHVYQSPYSQNGSTGPGSAPTTAIYYQYSPYMYDPSVIASPQSSSMLATAPNTAYQTPPPTAHHQLYVSANPAVSDSHSPNSAQTSAYCSASTASNSTTNMMTPCSSSMTSASCSATSVMPESSASGTSAVLSNGESPSTTGSPSLHQMLSSTSLSSSSTTAAAAPYAVVYQTPIASTVHQSGYMMYQQAPMRNPYQSHPSHVSYQATPTTTSSMQHVPVYASPTSPYVTPPAFYRDSNSRVRYNRHQKRDYYNKSQMFDSTPQALNFNQTMPGTPYIHQQAPTHYNQSESVEQGSDDLNSTITSVTNNTNPLIETQPVQQAMYSPYDYSMVSPIYQDPCMMSSSGLLPTQMGYNAYGMPVGPVTTPTSGTNTTGGVSPPLLPNYYASPAENFGTQFPLASAFACANEYDTYDENGNLVIEDFSKRRCFNFNDDEEIEDDGDEEKEQLACYVCRGRRMCFCYFLKVRYYKFPSFLDLVDHQYKKWKIGMQRARKAAAAAAAGGVPVATVAQ